MKVATSLNPATVEYVIYARDLAHVELMMTPTDFVGLLGCKQTCDLLLGSNTTISNMSFNSSLAHCVTYTPEVARDVKFEPIFTIERHYQNERVTGFHATHRHLVKSRLRTYNKMINLNRFPGVDAIYVELINISDPRLGMLLVSHLKDGIWTEAFQIPMPDFIINSLRSSKSPEWHEV